MNSASPILVQLPLDELRAFCQRSPIQRIAVFGSALRPDFTAESDIDLLVEYQADAHVTLVDMAQQELELSSLIGRKVDLRTPNELSRYFRQEVVNEAVTLYERN